MTRSHRQHTRENPSPDEQEHTAQSPKQEGQTPQWHEGVDLGDLRLVESLDRTVTESPTLFAAVLLPIADWNVMPRPEGVWNSTFEK